ISSGARPGSATAYLATSVRMDTRETAVCAHGGETVRHLLSVRRSLTWIQRVVNTTRYARDWMARTILVVEDEPTLRETVVDALESGGFRAIPARAGRRCPRLFPRE